MAGPSGPAFLYSFYPRSPCGERPLAPKQNSTQQRVSIHALLAESDGTSLIRIIGFLGFLSTLSLRRATSARPDNHRFCVVSIHALLAESDTKSDQEASNQPVSIHALLAESDVEKVPADVYYQAFLSTLSLRRATRAPPYNLIIHQVSIHALLAESDSIIDIINNIINGFYPRSPCGERPRAASCQQRSHQVSIHALLAESDRMSGDRL